MSDGFRLVSLVEEKGSQKVFEKAGAEIRRYVLFINVSGTNGKHNHN